ncbi:MAG: rod shape-determining protein MreD [Bryobacteraceae bacterium]|nr:rod shape-determining protein MreD [Bryobacteraceae bacterium]
MNEFSERLIQVPRKGSAFSFGPVALIVVPLVAILYQVYVSKFFEFLAFLDLPLLVTVYFSIMQRSPVAGLFTGGLIGLVQDSLSHQPLGILGIVKTLVGYFAASASLRFDISNPAVRFILGFFFFVFHHFLYWILVQALLGQDAAFAVGRVLLMALLNAVVAIPFFTLLDKLRVRG